MNSDNIKRIVTLGDSITQAETGQNSYRKALWEQLTSAGYNVDFVGSENKNKDNRNFENRNFDPDHEGHWGWRIDEIINGRGGEGKLSEWLTGYTPDVALIHLGSNDAIQNNSAISSVDELKQVIDILRQDNPNIAIFLAQVIPATGGRNSRIQELNNLIPGIVADKNQTNSPVILVDQNTGFNANIDTYDGVHPNDNGEAKMAQKWFDALKTYFDNVDNVDVTPPEKIEAINDSANTLKNSPVNIEILKNDNIEAENINLSIIDSTDNGTLTVNNNGTPTDVSDDFIVYTPDSDFVGVDSFTYSIDNGKGVSDTAKVTLNIADFNQIPVAINDSVTTEEDKSVSINVLLNDSDADGDNLTISSVNPGSNGNTEIVDNKIIYTPETGFSGVDSFSYEIDDGNGGNDTATVNVNVASVNNSPTAQNDSSNTEQDTEVTINVLENDSDPDGDNLTVSSVNPGSNGTTAIVDNKIIYTPEAGFSGKDSFTYKVTDGTETDTATVNVTVTKVAEPVQPTPSSRINAGLLALYNFNEGSGDTVFDVSGVGTALNLEINNLTATSWGNGILNLNAPSLIASNQTAGKIINGVIATQEITLEAWITPENKSQNGPARIATLSSNTANRNFTLGQAGDDYNVRLRTTSTGNNGVGTTVDSNGGLLETELTHVVYTRESDGDAFLYIDNKLVASKNISGDLSNWDETYRLGLGNELDGSRPWLGSFDLFAVYNQAFDAAEVKQNFFAGSESSPSSPPSPPSTPATPVNNIPVAVDDSITTKQDTEVNIDVLANDSDADSDNLTVTSVNSGSNGTTEIFDNKIIYTPEVGFSGEDIFTYEITDGKESDTAQVKVTVLEQPKPSQPIDNSRVDAGLLALYDFNEGSGDTVFDISGVGTALNLEIDNLTGISWGDGVLNVNAPSLIASNQTADKIIDGVTATQEITLEAWIIPENRSQNGPARIATLSSNIANRNFTLGQAGDDYNVRLRTTSTGNNGVGTTVSSEGGLLETELTHVVYTRESDGDAFLYVNNELVASENISGDLSNWDETYRLGLGNELDGNRPWLGSFDLFAVYNQAFDAAEVEQNFLANS